jgi:hypothetical protein
MTDRFQPPPSNPMQPARTGFEDAPEYTLRKPRRGTPTWGWVIILLLGLPLVCGGLLVGVAGLAWSRYSQLGPAPAPVAPPERVLDNSRIGDDPDLPANYNVDNVDFEKIGPPTPVSGSDDVSHDRPEPRP